MKLKVRAVHGQLNDGGFDSQRYAIAQHQPLTGRFLQASVIEPNCSLRAQYLASLQTTLQPYMWNAVILGLGMGERLSVPKEIKNIMRDTGTAHLMAISGLHIAFAALLAAGLIRGGSFSAWVLAPLANAIIGGNLLCCFLCLAYGNATSCIAYRGGACHLGECLS